MLYGSSRYFPVFPLKGKKIAKFLGQRICKENFSKKKSKKNYYYFWSYIYKYSAESISTICYTLKNE